jgi:hypothetical protein
MDLKKHLRYQFLAHNFFAVRWMAKTPPRTPAQTPRVVLSGAK